jgi:hypothetical protein
MARKKLVKLSNQELDDLCSAISALMREKGFKKSSPQTYKAMDKLGKRLLKIAIAKDTHV